MTIGAETDKSTNPLPGSLKYVNYTVSKKVYLDLKFDHGPIFFLFWNKLDLYQDWSGNTATRESWFKPFHYSSHHVYLGVQWLS